MLTPAATPLIIPRPMIRVVVGIWLVLLAGAGVFVGSYGPPTPYMDQWGEVVPVLSGEQPVTLEWLWAQHNEHRLPLAKLIETTLVSAAGGDFRAGMVFNVAVLGALALALPLALARHRGHAVVSDAVFPLLFLGWGQCETLLRGDVVGNVLTTALACVLLVVVASTAGVPTSRGALVAGAATALLPLCGATGLPFVPPLACWLLVVTRGGRTRPAVLALVAGALALAGAYLVGFQRPPYPPAPAGPASTLRVTTQFLAMAFGAAVVEEWTLMAVTIVTLIVVDAGLLLRAGIQSPSERPRVLGFAALLVALLLLALEVGIGRSVLGPAGGLAARYVVLAAPVIAHAYFVWELYAPPSLLRGGRLTVLALLLVLLPANIRSGEAYGLDRRRRADPFERDLRAGLPADTLARLHAASIFPDPPRFAARLEALRLARVRGFEHVSAAGDWSGLRAEPLALDHPQTHQMTWSDDLGRPTDADPFLVFPLGAPRFVYAVRLRYAYPEAPADDTAELEIFWRRARVEDFQAGVRTARRTVPAAPEGGVVTIEVFDTLDELRLDADPRRGALRVSEIALLVAR
jgi:hypothetical protein